MSSLESLPIPIYLIQESAYCTSNVSEVKPCFKRIYNEKRSVHLERRFLMPFDSAQGLRKLWLYIQLFCLHLCFKLNLQLSRAHTVIRDSKIGFISKR